MPRTHAYVRVSTSRQARKGQSLEEQEGRLRRYAAERLLGEIVLYVDRGVSASKVRFADREAGGALYRAARKGDHLIVTKLDRAFRNLFDFLETFDHWVKTGINVHIIDFGGNTIDATQPTGRAIIAILAVVAQLEREMIGQRVAEAHAFLREQGLYLNKNVPKGFAAVKNPKGRGYHAVPDAWTRKLMAEIVDWRDGRGMTFDAIRLHLIRHKVAFPNSKFRYWSPDNVFRLYERGKALAAAEAGAAPSPPESV